MTANALLVELKALGVRLWVEGGALEVEAPAGVLSPDRLAELRDHKPALIDLLARPTPEHAALLEEWRQIRERWSRGLVVDAAGYQSARQEAAAFRTFRELSARALEIWEVLTTEAPQVIPDGWQASPLPE